MTGVQTCALPISAFDAVGFTLQYELSYTNILAMLDLAGIPFYSKDRDESWPLIVAGGPCACNSEPVSYTHLDVYKRQAIDTVTWMPDWGHDRMHGMVRDRNDWCSSRQRTWGVPIPAFYCKKCGAYHITDATIKAVSDLFRKEGSDAWYKYDAEQIIPAGEVCEKTAFLFSVPLLSTVPDASDKKIHSQAHAGLPPV